jgi:hypothetical protein
MTLTKTALYRASLLTDNLGVRLCLAAVLVMPSALVFLAPLLGLFGADGDGPLAFAPGPGGWGAAFAALALCFGFAAAWMRVLFPGGRLLRRPGLRLFVVIALSIGTMTLAGELALRATAHAPDDDASWLLLAALAAHAFLLAGTLGQPRPERLNRI